ncbi:MYXO-CTERM sorting domain-containing protein [Polyangium jinanense]|uniref:MYXO-CTERM sorting domain-containing protein n=1 Tax=Polyangium jinanense TaxID=2829994 RepID=UPI00355A8314
MRRPWCDRSDGSGRRNGGRFLERLGRRPACAAHSIPPAAPSTGPSPCSSSWGVGGGPFGTTYRSTGGGCACHVGAFSEAPRGLVLLGLVPLLASRRRRRA